MFLDHSELDAKAYDYAQDKGHDEELKQSEAPHRTVWSIKYEDEEDICDGYGASGNKRDIEEQIERYCRANNLFPTVNKPETKDHVATVPLLYLSQP